MTENEKLRALLTEAREWVELNGEAGCPADQCEQCAMADEMLQRIDAALAEPVPTEIDWRSFLLKGYDKTVADSRWAKVAEVEKERDEARAEVERLRGEMGKVQEVMSDVLAGFPRAEAAAYQRGAEAMREAVASKINNKLTALARNTPSLYRVQQAVIDAIRALPIPEDKP